MPSNKETLKNLEKAKYNLNTYPELVEQIKKLVLRLKGASDPTEVGQLVGRIFNLLEKLEFESYPPKTEEPAVTTQEMLDRINRNSSKLSSDFSKELIGFLSELNTLSEEQRLDKGLLLWGLYEQSKKEIVLPCKAFMHSPWAVGAFITMFGIIFFETVLLLGFIL